MLPYGCKKRTIEQLLPNQNIISDLNYGQFHITGLFSLTSISGDCTACVISMENISLTNINANFKIATDIMSLSGRINAFFSKTIYGKDTVDPWIKKFKQFNVVGLNVMIWADQRDEQPDMMVYAKPACFLETILSTGLPIGANALSYEVTFRVMIEQEQYNSEGNIDVELSLLDLKDSVHRALQNFKPLNCSPMYQSGRELDYTQSNRYLVVLEYSSHFVDLMSTELDPAMGYIVDTIDAPILSMEEELFVGTINDDVVPTYAVV